MNREEFVKKLRIALGDETPPYRHEEAELLEEMEMALALYSKYKPMKKKGCIAVLPEQEQYLLPEDFQRAIRGLPAEEIFGGQIRIHSSQPYSLEFLYDADRGIADVPKADFPIFLDYCQAEMMERELMQSGMQEKEAGGAIAALRLGRGLDLTFDDKRTLERELYQAIRQKKQRFYECFGRRRFGGFF